MRCSLVFTMLILCPAICLAQDPSVDVKCNGLDSGVLIDPGSIARITFDVTAGSGAGNTVDVWVVTETPHGYFSYDGTGAYAGWAYGFGNVYYTGPLTDFSDTPFDGVPPEGHYTTFVAMDAWANGRLDVNLIFVLDSVDFLVGYPPPPGMVAIPAGTFEMGDHHGVGDPDEVPVHTVTLDAFFMDIYELTNSIYCDYLNSAYAQGLIEVRNGEVYKYGDTEPYLDTSSADGDSRIHWDGQVFTVEPGKEDHCLLEVSWYGAAAYCNWRSAQEGLTPCFDLEAWTCDFTVDGYRLPTEAEWEYAARGGEHNPYYKYPWGDPINGSCANYVNSGDPYETGPTPWTTPVGYYDGNQIPAGVDMVNGYGLYDMSGNIMVWCYDWYDGSYYSSSPSDNPRGPASGDYRVLRGGYWYYDTTKLRCAFRYRHYPDRRHNPYAIRVARSDFR